MTKQVSVRLADAEVAALDSAVAQGHYATRSDALRAGVARLLKEERDREIEHEYRRGYGEHPQEEWIGEAGLAALAAFHRAEGGGDL